MKHLIHIYNDSCLIAGVILPLLVALIPIVFRKMPKLRDLLNLFFIFLSFLMIVNMAIYHHENHHIKANIFQFMGNISFGFKLETFGLIFALLASFLWLITTIYSMGYVQKTDRTANRFYIFIALSMSFTYAICFSANLFTMFIFYELLTISTYPLIALDGSLGSKKAARRYLYILFGSSVIFLLPAIIAIYEITGTLDFAKHGILVGKISPLGTSILLFCFIFGTAKIAIMPLHKWLPSAMVASIPVSALLHTVAVVKSGIFFIIKSIIYIFGIDNLSMISKEFSFLNNWLIITACLSIIFSSIFAARQKELKALLAYSTISNLSYSILAASIFTDKEIIAAIFVMIAHALAKITLFFVAGIIYKSTGKTKINEMNGLGKSMKIATLCFIIGSLSIIGIPPFSAFLGKYYIVSNVWSSNHAVMIAVTMVISTCVSGFYYTKIIHHLVWRSQDMDNVTYVSKPSKLMMIATVIVAVATLITSIFAANILLLVHHIFEYRHAA